MKKTEGKNIEGKRTGVEKAEVRNRVGGKT